MLEGKVTTAGADLIAYHRHVTRIYFIVWSFGLIQVRADGGQVIYAGTTLLKVRVEVYGEYGKENEECLGTSKDL